MHKGIILLFVAFICTGCGEGFDPTMCFLTVREKYENSAPLPNERYRFIVRDEKNNVHYVETLGSDTKITKDIILIKGSYETRSE